MEKLPFLQDYKIILASNSPRRKELLRGLNIDFEVRIIPDIDESHPFGLPIDEIAEYIATQKSEAYIPTLKENELLITADTIVSCEGKLLGKPSGYEDAVHMLHELSGRVHEVISGVCVYTVQRSIRFSTMSEVRFATLTDEEIRFYVEQYKP